MPGGSWMLEDLEPAAKRHRLVSYDPRGRGRSDAVPLERPPTLEVDLADLEQVAGWFELERSSSLAIDYQAALAAYYAGHHPERVAHRDGQPVPESGRMPRFGAPQRFFPPSRAGSRRSPAPDAPARLTRRAEPAVRSATVQCLQRRRAPHPRARSAACAVALLVPRLHGTDPASTRAVMLALDLTILTVRSSVRR